MHSEIFENSFKIDPKMVPNSWKIDLWSCLGALWAPFWRQGGPRATARPRKHEKYKIFWWLQGSQMISKLVKKVIENRVDFRSDLERLFLDLGSILDPKTDPKWGVSGSFVQPLCKYAKSVIWNNPPSFLLYFSTLKALIFDLKGGIFQLFFRRGS